MTDPDGDPERANKRNERQQFMTDKALPQSVTIPLTQGKVAIIDSDDAERVSRFKWCAHKMPDGRTWYAVTNRLGFTLAMHRLIAAGQFVDHKNRNGLDNRKENLRPANKSLNMANSIRRAGTSKFKGVYWNKKDRRWMARIKVNDKTRYLGSFTDEAVAAKAYVTAAIEAWGEFNLFAEKEKRGAM